MESSKPPAATPLSWPWVACATALALGLGIDPAAAESGAPGAEPAGWSAEMSLTTLVLTAGILVSLTLSVISLRRPEPVPPAPTPGLSLDELREMRSSVSAFANLLRDGSAVLLKTNAGTIETANRLAARSEELLALVADAEARLQDATERSEILATRVARSAAGEIKQAVRELNDISIRLHQSVPPSTDAAPPDPQPDARAA